MSYNGSLLYFSSGKAQNNASVDDRKNKYKLNIEFNPMTAIEYSSCYK